MKRHIQQQLVRLYLAALLVPLVCTVAQAQATAFTYQGKFADSGTPATGNYDFEFKLFNTPGVGTGAQVGSTVQRLNVSVANGIFTVSLDFGACASCFNGADRFLEISVKPTATGVFVTLGPRQPITSTPYALKSVNATTSDGLSVTCVNCVTSSQIGSVTGSAVSGAIPVASVPSGSANYIQNNPASKQSSSSFNINGSGTASGTLSANIVNATMQYNINGNRVLGNAGSQNLFAGVGAGAANTTSAAHNSFFGHFAGSLNTDGSFNSFFGRSAGSSNTTGGTNSFFGTSAGTDNTTGAVNAFFGAVAGGTNTTGSLNSFFGTAAGDVNTIGSENTIIGAEADVGANNLFNATAIGARAMVGQSNSLVLGSINGVNFATESVNVGIGLTAPKTRLDVVSAQSQIRFGNNSADSGGYLLSTVPSQAVLAGGAKWDGDDFVAKSTESSVINMFNGTIRFSNNTGLTPGATFSATEVMRITSSGNVGIGNTNPTDKLVVVGNIKVGTSGTNGCLKNFNGDGIVGACSSDARLKQAITPFPSTLDNLVRLRPVHFYWRAKEYPSMKFGESQSFGLIAQEVEQVMPELVTEDEEGMKAVNYSKLPILMLQAIKELKAENDALKERGEALREQIRQHREHIDETGKESARQQEQINRQQRDFESLKRIVCLDHPNIEACRARRNNQ